MPVITMLDIAKRRHSAKEVGLIEANLSAAPELKYFPARTIEGTSYKTLLRTGYPTAQFTGVNEGVQPSKSTYANRTVECYPIRSLIQVDKSLVSADNPLATLLADESAGVTEAVMRLLGRQVWYGAQSGKGDAKGFPGLQDLVDAAMVVDATGTAANAATSVYFVKFGLKDVQLIFGNNTVLTLPPFRDETITDANGGKLDGKVSHLTGWAGIQCVNPASVVRIKNVTAEANKGVTDALLAKGLNAFPLGVIPDAIFMTRQSRTQLQIDRSARTAARTDGKPGSMGGGDVYAPLPDNFQGIPIVVTDSLLNTEAIA